MVFKPVGIDENSLFPPRVEKRFPTTSPIVYGAKGDGITNDSAAFTAMLTAVPAGSIIDLGGRTYLLGNTFEINKTIELRSGTLTSAGKRCARISAAGVICRDVYFNRTTTSIGTDDGSALFVNAANFLSIDCDYRSSSRQPLRLGHATANGTTIRGGICYPESAIEDTAGIYVNPGSTGNLDITIDGVTVQGNGFSTNGISIYDASRCTVRNCVVDTATMIPQVIVTSGWTLVTGDVYSRTDPQAAGGNVTNAVFNAATEYTESVGDPTNPTASTYGTSNGLIYLNLGGTNPNTLSITCRTVSGYGILFYSTVNGPGNMSDNKVEHCRVRNTDGFGIYFQLDTSDARRNGSVGNILTNVCLKGRQTLQLPFAGMAIIGGEETTFVNDRIDTVGAAGFPAPGFRTAPSTDINSASGTLTGMQVRNAVEDAGIAVRAGQWRLVGCRSTENYNYGFKILQGFSGDVVDIDLVGCQSYDNNSHGFGADALSGEIYRINILGGHYHNNNGRSIDLIDVKSAKVVGATCYEPASGQYNISIGAGCEHVIVDDVTFYSGNGINVLSTSNDIVIGKITSDVTTTNQLTVTGGTYVRVGGFSSSTGRFGEFLGTGSPEGVVSASVGSIFHRTDGGSATTLYVKETGSTGNTGWAASGSGGGGGGLDAEGVRDTIAAALVAGSNVTITPNDVTDTITISSSGGGSGAGDAFLTVAANDTPAAQKNNADYVCDGTNDHVEIQAAIDLVTSTGLKAGKVTLLPGTYTIAATISISDPADAGTTTTRFELNGSGRGARVRWLGVGAEVPLVKIESSDAIVSELWVEGSGNKGNGIGICFGGDTTNYGGRITKTVYRSKAENCYVTNCNKGMCFAINKLGTSSSGDNVIEGGFITNCKEGINSAGFVNRVIGTTIAGCNENIHGTADRNSHKIECFGVTLNNWASHVIWLEKDHGSLFDGCWMEHTAAQSAVPTEAILLGGTTNSTYKAQNTRFAGTTFLTLHDETYGIKIINGQNIRIDNLCMSTDGALPLTSVIREESSNTGLVTVDRLCWGTGSVPGAWTYSKILSTAATTPRVVVKAIPGSAGASSNTTFGDTTPTPAEPTYYIDKSGAANSATYWAKDRRGHIAAFAGDTSTTSGLKSVLASLTTNDVHFQFGPGRYHFKDAPVGNEAWASIEDHANFGTGTSPTKGLTFSGTGMYSTTISNRSNWVGSADTEPFSFTNCQYVTMRDFTVESGGTYKSTTDAIDFDQGAHIRVERVRITRSRARGLIVDGGDPGKWGGKNVIRDCLIQGRPDKPGLSTVSGGSLTASTQYRYVVSWTEADLAGAQVAGETKPSDENVIATDASSRSVRVDIAIGPYSVTERKVYRALVGSTSWVRVATITNNTDTTYTDTGGAGTGVTMPVSHRSTVPDSAIELLGCSNTDVLNNVIDGTGDFTVGLNRHGINVSRKSTVPTASNYNKVIGNTVRQCAGNGIRVIGGVDNMVKDNNVSNSGTVETRAACLRVEGATGVSTLRNEFRNNRCFDDQDANSWSTGLTVNNQMSISATGTPTDTIVNGNIFTPGASGANATVSDAGTNSQIWDNYGFGAEYSLVEYGTSQSGNFTIGQSMSNQTILITGLSTVTLPALKQGTIVWLIRDTASAVTLAVSGTTLDKPSTNSASPRAQYSKICLEWLTTTRILETGDMG